MEIIKVLLKNIINIILWLWSHCPVACLSNDDEFATLKIEDINKAHLRFSVINIMLGDSIVYILSFDIKERKFALLKMLQLVEIDGNSLEDNRIDQIQSTFREHIEGLSDDDLEIEKEKLIYHIEREEQRIDTSVDKINIYATIILTVIPIVMALIDFGTIKELSVVLQVMICIAIYGLLNICIFVFRTIKVRGIKKSTFSDLRNSTDRKKEIVVQYQYDWQQLKYKAQLFVSFVINLQEWVIFILLLTISISIGISKLNDSESKSEFQNIDSAVFTINIDEISTPYTNSSVDWQTLILDVEAKKSEHLIILTNSYELPEEVEELKKYKHLQIEIIYDEHMNDDIFKIVEVK